MKTINTRTLVSASVLTSISIILSYFPEFTPPFTPGFLKLDFSDFPALLAAFTFSPLVGVAVELVKNSIHLFTSTTRGIGELANLLIGSSLIFTAGIIYKRFRTLKGALISLTLGTVVMAIVGGAVNYFILIPLYSELFLPTTAIIAMCKTFIPFINTKLDIIIFTIIPFNIVKGLLISFITFILYKRLKPILKSK